MAARFLADAVVALHLAFVAFVVAGAFLALRWPRLLWLQIPCAVYGVAIELFGWICPLTYLENALRERAGRSGYSGGFVEHYLLPLLYPDPLPRSVTLALAATVVVTNALAYLLLLRRLRMSGRRGSRESTR
jgi:hypothetical protein